MKRLTLLLLGLISLSTYQTNAHTRLTAAMPADSTISSTSPEEIVLKFSTKVRLLSIQLRDVDGTVIKLGLIPEKTQMEFSLPILVELTPGEYLATWRAVGADTHAVSGDLSFTVASGEAAVSH